MRKIKKVALTELIAQHDVNIINSKLILVIEEPD
jgi:hypothetical protein